MQELLRRLFRSKRLAVEIIVASFFVNILASPIFVIQILSRYIGYGFDGTLYTLTGGMLIALALGVAFTIVRTRMCTAVSLEPDQRLQAVVLDALTRIKAAAFDAIPKARVHEIMAAPQSVQAAYEASRITAVLDMPFFILFILAILFLSPLLAALTLLAIVVTVALGIMSTRRSRLADQALREANIRHRSGVNSAIDGSETVRAFHGSGFLHDIWEKQVDDLMHFKENLVGHGSRSMAFTQGLNSLLRVSIYAAGAKQVVNGDLTVGALIGVSILSAKALQLGSNFMQTVSLLGKAEDAMRIIREFTALPRESTNGVGMKEYSGRLEFRDMAMLFAGATGPLFESLTCDIEPGTVVGIVGANGAGKTSLCKMIVGLLDPVRGQILADGVELRQLAPGWWRKQVMYLPQEPTFLNGTYRDNITMLNPEINDADLNKVVKAADLRKFLDTSTQGLDTEIFDGGRSLPMGIRKRLALARGLAGNGRLAVFDEPTEGVDNEGAQAVFKVMNLLAQKNVTMIVVSRDPNILKGLGVVIDLNVKPMPRVGVVKKHTQSSGVDEVHMA